MKKLNDIQKIEKAEKQLQSAKEIISQVKNNDLSATMAKIQILDESLNAGLEDLFKFKLSLLNKFIFLGTSIGLKQVNYGETVYKISSNRSYTFVTIENEGQESAENFMKKINDNQTAGKWDELCIAIWESAIAQVCIKGDQCSDRSQETQKLLQQLEEMKSGMTLISK